MSSIAQPHRGFGDIVDLVRSKHATTNAEAEHPQTPPLAIQPQLPRHEETAAEKAEHSMTVADIHTALKERGAAKDEPPKHHTKMPSEGQGHKVRGEEESKDGEKLEPEAQVRSEKKLVAEVGSSKASAHGEDGKSQGGHDEKVTQHSRSHRRRPTVQTDHMSEISPRTSNASRSQSHPYRTGRKSSTSAGYGHYAYKPGTPSGPPRSISFHYSMTGANTPSRSNSAAHDEGSHFLSVPGSSGKEDVEDPDHAADFAPATSPFRSALDYDDPEQRERERELAEKKGKRKQRDSYFPETWNPAKWLSDSPREEPAPFTNEPQQVEGTVSEDDRGEGPSSRQSMHVRIPTISSDHPRLSPDKRSRSMPYIKADSKDSKGGSGMPRWTRLRAFIPHLASQGRAQSGANAPSAVVPHTVNITDELMIGGLATLIPRLWFERDEKDHRRVPILFHRLRIRVSDSLHPMHGHKAVFRIECEYANGAARWVIYRQLREFLSLHTHYAISNAYNRNVETLPDFPMTSLYYKNDISLDFD